MKSIDIIEEQGQYYNNDEEGHVVLQAWESDPSTGI
jgi:hypothetical protein